jgi:hypothetical protein
MQASRRLRVTAPTEAVETEEPRIVRHPDGFYWRNALHEVGPFATLEDALADMGSAPAGEEATLASDESLPQVEDDIGVASWIDRDTGSLAEEQPPRIEEH